jgi:hypothetical protein
MAYDYNRTAASEAWRATGAEIESIHAELEAMTERLAVLSKQALAWGNTEMPPETGMQPSDFRPQAKRIAHGLDNAAKATGNAASSMSLMRDWFKNAAKLIDTGKHL